MIQDLLKVGRLHVHPGVALVAAVGGELLELAKPYSPVDTDFYTLSLLASAFLYQVLLGLVAQLRHSQSISVEAVGCSFEGIYHKRG